MLEDSIPAPNTYLWNLSVFAYPSRMYYQLRVQSLVLHPEAD